MKVVKRVDKIFYKLVLRHEKIDFWSKNLNENRRKTWKSLEQFWLNKFDIDKNMCILVGFKYMKIL